MKIPEEHSLAKKYAELEKELAQKSREIEIQSALEKVRASAMAIQQPDDMPDVCRTICGQLELLGLQEIRNIQTAIIYESRSIYMNYEYYRLSDKTFITPVQYGHPVQADFVKRMLVEGAYHIVTLDGNELKDWFEYQKTTNQFIDTHLEEAGGVYYHWFSIGPVALGISLYKQISDDGIALFRRFLEVFRLAYRRYLDVEKAVAQAREARIETALERVRAVAMAMRKAEEVFGVCKTTYNELIALGFTNLRNTQILVSKKETQTYLVCDYSAGHGMPMREAPPNAHPLMGEILTGIEKSNDALFQKQISGKEFEAWRTWRHNIHAEKDLRLDKITSLCFYFYSTGLGALGISSYDPITDDELDILKRFKKVFELAYTRYADVATAEAQAREGQIQLALERVRARTMAMQQSNELADAAALLFNQIKELGLSAWSAGFDIWDDDDKFCTAYNAMGSGSIGEGHRLPMTEDPFFKTIYEAKKRGDDFLVFESGGESLAETYHYIKTLPGIGDFMRATENEGVALPKHQVTHCCFSSRWHLMFITTGHNPEAWDIYKRFAKVFDQTYTRFLDLQKAEAQAREAQIEAALERVRSKTIAMHNSADVAGSVLALFNEVAKLGIETIRCGIGIMHDGGQMELWTGFLNEAGKADLVIGYLDMTMHPLLDGGYTGWKNKEKSYVYELRGADLVNYYTIINNHPNYPVKYDLSSLPGRIIHSEFYFPEGTLYAFTLDDLSAASKNIFTRFAGVFGQTYRRYLDLQKAEEQSRESQIQLALERVRARTMAMQQSVELAETSVVLFQQMIGLGIAPNRLFIGIIKDGTSDMEMWATEEDGSKLSSGFAFSPEKNATVKKMYDGWRQQQKSIIIDMQGTELEDYFHYLEKELKVPFKVGLSQKRRVQSVAYFSEGFVGMASPDEQSAETIRLMERFAGVFNLTYTRFNDLQKAEAQAREAQIEASLERVRSKAMAMHKSKDLQTAVSTVFEELEKLNLGLLRCGIGIIDKEKRMGDIWTTVKSGDESLVQVSGNEPFDMHPLMEGTFNAWLAQTDFSYILEGADLAAYYQAVATTNFTLPQSQFALADGDGLKQYYYTPTFKAGNLYAFKDTAFTDDAKKVVQRFASVLNLTFNRFFDLQRAEAQARESQIELALERVRARSMAMQKSNELAELIQLTFEQFLLLGFSIHVAAFVTDFEERSEVRWWMATPMQKFPAKILLPVIDHPFFLYNSFIVLDEGKDFYSDRLTFEEKNSFLRHFFKYYPPASEERKQLLFAAPGYARSAIIAKNIALAIANYSDIPYTEQENAILRRFGVAFDQSNTRFLDLQKAETQAKEVVKQASVDRVRADIASMRTTADLERITPLIWNELTTLGVPFIRSGVFIVDETAELIHTYLSSPDGNALAAFDVPFGVEGLGREIVPAWRKKQVAIVHWTKEEFAASTKNLVNQGALGSGEKLVTERPDTSLDLHLFPFLQGMLYVGNAVPLGADDMDLAQSLAEAFSTAYARYEDFNKLEAAKAQVENTLTELKSAQTQLVQKEKMASLGELTAGIAHEIQNPLNFVNNFSEVNREMLEELKAESKKPKAERDEQFEIELINDLINNEEKISHHGKRADSIVKGMLQHSRSSGGEKLPTDMNALADEYFRLSYHGLRAKDKNFNAEMITRFDESLPKIEVVQQDIGRVFLNLFNNAFYAVNEKKKTAEPGYKPTVELSTFTSPSADGGWGALVRDNGNGIPDSIKDKIMQPFFTTKPTGEGTGLGLSLSYDIVVKGHGGSITVDTKEGKFTEFIVTLPV